MTSQAEIPLKKIIQALLDVDTPLNPRYLYSLSDLEKTDLAELSKVWDQIPAWRRKALLEDVQLLGEDDTLLSFEALAHFALQDADPAVRLPAVHVLWNYDSLALLDPLLKLAEHDPVDEVRAAVATALGQYVYLGEMEEIPVKRLQTVEEALLRLAQPGQPEPVRQEALMALGFSSREEAPALIESAYRTGDKAWMASAAVAMGRSANNRWIEAVQELLGSLHPRVRAAAVQAAGELEIQAAAPRLIDLLDDPDPQVHQAAIWSLSQIGGHGVRDILEDLAEQAEDEDEIELLDEALENLTFTEELSNLPLLDMLDSEEDELEELLELDEDEDEEEDEG